MKTLCAHHKLSRLKLYRIIYYIIRNTLDAIHVWLVSISDRGRTITFRKEYSYCNWSKLISVSLLRNFAPLYEIKSIMSTFFFNKKQIDSIKCYLLAINSLFPQIQNYVFSKQMAFRVQNCKIYLPFCPI